MPEYVIIADASCSRAIVRPIVHDDTKDYEELVEKVAEEEGLSFGNCVWQVVTDIDIRF